MTTLPRSLFVASLSCALIACGVDNSGTSTAKADGASGARSLEARGQNVLIFKGDKLVIWGEGTRAVPPVAPGSTLDRSLFKSMAPDVVSVEADASVVAHHAGTTQLRSSSGSAIEVVVHSTVGFLLSPAALQVGTGATAQLTVYTADGKLAPDDVEWMTDAPTVASVDRGRVTAGQSGSATITVRAGAQVASTLVTVSERAGSLRPIAVLGPSGPVSRGSVFQVYPHDQLAGAVQWTSSAPSILKPLSGGIFQATGLGRAAACVRSTTARGCVAVVIR
jgi:hypothetical protein